MGSGAEEPDGEGQQGQRHRALEIHDDVVQWLALAKLSIELGDTATGLAAIEDALGAARRLVSDLLDADDTTLDLTEGALRRDAPAGLA